MVEISAVLYKMANIKAIKKAKMKKAGNEDGNKE